MTQHALQYVFVISTSGLVLFEKHYVEGLQYPRMTGSLLGAITEFSEKAVGKPVSYFEMTTSAVSMHRVPSKTLKDGSKKPGTITALFHAPELGGTFGSILARQISDAFWTDFDGKFNNVADVAQFEKFGLKLTEIARGCIEPIVARLKTALASTRSLKAECFVVLEDERRVVPSSVDHIRILPCMMALINRAADIFTLTDDAPHSIEMGGAGSHTVVRRIGRAMLIVTGRRPLPPALQDEVDSTAALLANVFMTINP